MSDSGRRRAERQKHPERRLPLVLLVLGALASGVAWVFLVQAAIDFAKQQTLIRYNKGIAGGAYTNLPSTGEGPMTMALAAYAGNTTADTRLLEQIRHVLIGGNDIPANGGYPAQHERHMTGTFALALTV